MAQGLLGRREAARSAPPGSRTRSAGRRPPRAARPRSAARAPRTPPGAAARGGGRGPGRRGAVAAARRAGGAGARRCGPRVAPGRKSDRARRTARSCWSGATRCWRRCAPTCRRPRSTSRRASTSTSGSPRSSGPPPTGASPMLEISRAELDRMTGGVLHQGVGLQVPPFAYEPFDDLVAAALEQPAPLLVALDGVTDPRNLGAVVRSAAAFGAQGVVRARAAGGRHDRDRLADQRRRRGPGADRPGDQPDPGAEGVPGGRLHGGRAGRRRRRPPLRPGGRGRPAGRGGRLRGARACPGWSARPATCASASR